MVEGNTFIKHQGKGAFKRLCLWCFNRLLRCMAGLFTLLVSFGAEPVEAQIPHQLQPRLTVSLAGAYSSQDVSWSIAGNQSGQKPNIYSELKWNNQRGVGINAIGRYRVYKSIFIRVAYERYAISNGHVTDTDYGADDRTDERFYVKLPTTKGISQDLNGIAGYEFNINDRLSVDAAAGYVESRQHLYLNDDETQLNSSYTTNWYGALLLLRPVYSPCERLKISAAISYSQLKYKASANWDLINEFAHPESFRHNANGYGLGSALNLGYRLTNCIGLSAGANVYRYETGNGIDKLFLANGQTRTTQFNGAVRQGYSFNCGIIVKI
jgi:hypothetical protein